MGAGRAAGADLGSALVRVVVIWSIVSPRLVRLAYLIPLLLGLLLALAAAGNVAERASALPCRTCPEPPPQPDPPAPEDPTPAPTTPTPPPTTTETVSATLTVTTNRGAVRDGAGLDCPAGSCTRKLTYTRTCPAGDCPAWSYSTLTLTVTPVAGYTAKWDGCTPRTSGPTDCDVTLDSDRTVKVNWTKSSGGASVDPTPVRDGSPVTPGAGDSGATTTVSGTVETSRVASKAAKRGEIRSAVRYSFRRSNEWTEFTALSVRYLPRGARVRTACRGSDCPKGAAIAARRDSVRLGRLMHRRFAVGTVLTVRVSAPDRRARTTRMIVRRGKDPRITSRSAR